MHTVDCTTRIAGLASFNYENDSYPVTVTVPDTLAEALAVIGKCDQGEVSIDAPEGAQVALLGFIHSSWVQNGKQGDKESIRKAIAEGDQDKVDEAIRNHQEKAIGYRPNSVRAQAPLGVTKTKAAKVGQEILKRMGPEALLAMAIEQGIDPDKL